MTVYILAQIAIHDHERYQRYQAAFMPILTQYGGRLLAADEVPERLQGDWPHQKIVLMQFDDQAAAERWAGSPEYQGISEDWIAATSGVALLVHGLSAAAKSEA